MRKINRNRKHALRNAHTYQPGKKTFSRGGGDFMKNEKFEKNEKENCNWYKRAVR